MLSLSDVDRFFEELDRQFGKPLGILITGAVAGALMGNARPSDDIDFEVQLEDPDLNEQLQDCINKVGQKLQIPAQYTQDIEGWGQIKLLDYRETALPYKKIGQIKIKFLSPEYWAIGKLTRYLPLDKADLVKVLKAKKTSPRKSIAIWGKALRASPLSDRSREFKNHVIDFLKSEGAGIWTKDFDAESFVTLFKEQAGVK